MKKFIQSISNAMRVTRKQLTVCRDIKGWIFAVFILAVTKDTVFSITLGKSYQGILDKAQSSSNQLMKTISFYLILVILYAVIWGFLDSYINFRMKAKCSILLRERLFHALMHADRMALEKQEIADLEKQYSQDVNNTAQFIGRGICTQIVSPFLAGIVCSVLLIYIHPILFITAASIGFLCFMAQNRFVFSAKELNDELTSERGVFSSRIFDLLRDIAVIRTMGAAHTFLDGIEKSNEKIYTLNMKILKIDIKQSSLNLIIKTIQSLLIIIVGGILISDEKLGYGQLLAAVQYAGTVMGMFTAMSSGITRIQSGRASAEIILHTLEMDQHIDYREIQNDNIQTTAAVEIKDLSFRIDDHEILSNITFNIDKGKLVAITGPSGSGKTTLAKVLSGIYPVAQGNLQLNGPLRYIPSSSYLFKDSIRNNISLYDTMTEETLLKVLEKADLNAFVSNLTDGLETTITNAGSNVSGGEKQRISIARTLAHPASIFLWDEPTSALDPDYRERFVSILHELCHQSTVLVITHDSDIINRADEVIRMENGSIVSMIA